jgi:hypothetical protein
MMSPWKSDAPGLAGSILRFWRRSYGSDYVGFALLMAAYVYVSIQCCLRIVLSLNPPGANVC